MTKRKADCTPDEWAAVLILHRKYGKEFRRTPEGRAYGRIRARKYRQTSAGKATVLKKYNITYDFKETLMLLQEGKCAICRRSFSFACLEHVDHCHDTKQVRGLLCMACNLAEGHIKKLKLTPEEFGKRLAAYLTNPPARVVELIA